MSYADGSKEIAAALDRIDGIWKTYTSTYLTNEEKNLVAKVET